MRHLPAAIALAVITLSSLACQKDEPVPRDLRIGVLVWDFNDAVHSRDRAARDKALRTLTDLGPDAVAGLAKLLDDPNSVSYSATMAVLTARGREEAFERAVMDALAHPSRRWYRAPDRLEQLGPVAMRPLVIHYGPDLPVATRLSILEHVAPAASPDARRLVERSMSDSAPEVLAVAAVWLGCLHGHDALPRLESLLGHSDVGVRAGAIGGLRCLGDPRAVPALLRVLLQPPVPVPPPFNVENPAVEAHDDETPEDTLQRRSASVIDEIAGTGFDGRTQLILEWLSEQPELQQARPGGVSPSRAE